MLSHLPKKWIDSLTIKDLEDLLDLKKRNVQLSDLLRERERLRLELRRIEDSIESVERLSQAEQAQRTAEAPEPQNSFLSGRRKKNLKDYIAQVLLEAREPLSPSEIQRRLPEVGYQSSSTNPRSFYNTVFQALQRYEAFAKEGKRYKLSDESLPADEGPPQEILPRKKTRLKDFIVEVLGQSSGPLKVSEIASRVVIAGYETDLGMDELTQRVSATLKKYLNKDFEWDSQRYRLASQS